MGLGVLLAWGGDGALGQSTPGAAGGTNGVRRTIPAARIQPSPAARTTLTTVKSVPISEAARVMLAEVDAGHLALGPQPAGAFEGKTRTALFLEREAAARRVRETALKFHESNPKDPLRWEGILHALMVPSDFIQGFKPGFDDAPTLSTNHWIVDEKARAAWQVRAGELDREFERAADVPWEVGERHAHYRFTQVMRESRGSGEGTKRGQELAAALASRYPEGRLAVAACLEVARLGGIQGTAAAGGYWAGLTNSPNGEVRKRATAEIRLAEGRSRPVELTFTALDGREVDLAKMRGKVVLIDFWATWCGPCIAELPNVRAAYEKWHDRGFEIVGVSLDQQDAREKLEAFVAKNRMPWPQHFDGKGWRNSVAETYAVTAIPAMFLLNKEGVIISTNARGPKLEEELKRLLGE